IIKDWVSNDEEQDESMTKPEKKTIIPSAAKREKLIKRANGFNAVKPSTCWVWRPIKPNSASITLNGYNYIDAQGRSNGCSRQMTGNIAYLSDFKQFDRGYVAFRGGAYGCKISSKGTLKTANLDFEDVYFVNELKFNLFSVLQMCDKKNYVLFTDTECLGSYIRISKLPMKLDILKFPRKEQYYNFDMKNIIEPTSIAKALSSSSWVEAMQEEPLQFKLQ
ncbi:hypothetical protein Tco_1462263, partial [Tanacetum coccineum]